MALCRDRACRTPKRVAKSNLVGPGATFSHEMKVARQKSRSTAILRVQIQPVPVTWRSNSKNSGKVRFLAPDAFLTKLVKKLKRQAQQFRRRMQFFKCKCNPLAQDDGPTSQTDEELRSQTQPFARNDGRTSKIFKKIEACKSCSAERLLCVKASVCKSFSV